MNHILTIESFIEKDKNPNYMTFWHGGNLDDISIKGNKGGRRFYGSGLYLAKNYEDVQKYARGSRKLYKVVVEKGNDISDVNLDVSKVIDFIETYVSKRKQKLIIPRIENYTKNGLVPADVFNNILINEKAIRTSDQVDLLNFLIDNGIDYEYLGNVSYAQGSMMVLYNINKIKDITRVTGKHVIKDFVF